MSRPADEVLIKITSDAQITDGRFRGRTLVNSVSPYALQTNRKLRDTVFNLISKRVKGGRVLDLGAGSGTIGIEAISRGAMLATLVERSARMCSFLRKNLAEIGIKDGHSEVVESEAFPFLKKAALRKRVWDIVYLDTPECDEHTAILELLGRGYGIKPRGLAIVSHPASSTCPANLNLLKRWRTIEHEETILTIYERI